MSEVYRFRKFEDAILPLDEAAVTWWGAVDNGATVEISPVNKGRTWNQLALLHVWFREMANHFHERGADLGATQADREYAMKMMMKHRFLGTKDIVVNKTTIPGQVRDLPTKRGELNYFMNQVEAWAIDHGVLLSMPHDSEYMEIRRELNE